MNVKRSNIIDVVFCGNENVGSHGEIRTLFPKKWSGAFERILKKQLWIGNSSSEVPMSSEAKHAFETVFLKDSSTISSTGGGGVSMSDAEKKVVGESSEFGYVLRVNSLVDNAKKMFVRIKVMNIVNLKAQIEKNANPHGLISSYQTIWIICFGSEESFKVLESFLWDRFMFFVQRKLIFLGYKISFRKGGYTPYKSFSKSFNSLFFYIEEKEAFLKIFHSYFHKVRCRGVEDPPVKIDYEGIKSKCAIVQKECDEVIAKTRRVLFSYEKRLKQIEELKDTWKETENDIKEFQKFAVEDKTKKKIGTWISFNQRNEKNLFLIYEKEIMQVHSVRDYIKTYSVKQEFFKVLNNCCEKLQTIEKKLTNDETDIEQIAKEIYGSINSLYMDEDQGIRSSLELFHDPNLIAVKRVIEKVNSLSQMKVPEIIIEFRKKCNVMTEMTKSTYDLEKRLQKKIMKKNLSGEQDAENRKEMNLLNEKYNENLRDIFKIQEELNSSKNRIMMYNSSFPSLYLQVNWNFRRVNNLVKHLDRIELIEAEHNRLLEVYESDFSEMVKEEVYEKKKRQLDDLCQFALTEIKKISNLNEGFPLSVMLNSTLTKVLLSQGLFVKVKNFSDVYNEVEYLFALKEKRDSMDERIRMLFHEDNLKKDIFEDQKKCNSYVNYLRISFEKALRSLNKLTLEKDKYYSYIERCRTKLVETIKIAAQENMLFYGKLFQSGKIKKKSTKGLLYFGQLTNNGEREGIGKEIVDGKIVFYGKFKKNVRHGIGKEFKFAGEYDQWKNKIKDVQMELPCKWTNGNGPSLVINNIANIDIIPIQKIDLKKQKIFKQLHMKNKIGSGAYSEVFKVVLPKKLIPGGFKEQKNEYALKLCKVSTSTKHFLNECKFMGYLQHPYVCKIFFYSAGSHHSIVMEYCESNVSTEIIEKTLSFSEKIVIMYQLTLAIDYIHEMEFFHRDLKWENVLLKDSVVRLADFGMTKLTEAFRDTAKHSIAVGTVAYLAPELTNGRQNGFEKINYTNKADIFSLGIMFFELLTDSTNPYNIDFEHKYWEVNQIDTKVAKDPNYRPKFPKEFEGWLVTLCSDCWNHDPKKRPSASTILERIKKNCPDIVKKVEEKTKEIIDNQRVLEGSIATGKESVVEKEVKLEEVNDGNLKEDAPLKFFVPENRFSLDCLRNENLIKHSNELIKGKDIKHWTKDDISRFLKLIDMMEFEQSVFKKVKSGVELERLSMILESEKAQEETVQRIFLKLPRKYNLRKHLKPALFSYYLYYLQTKRTFSLTDRNLILKVVKFFEDHWATNKKNDRFPVAKDVYKMISILTSDPKKYSQKYFPNFSGRIQVHLVLLQKKGYKKKKKLAKKRASILSIFQTDSSLKISNLNLKNLDVGLLLNGLLLRWSPHKLIVLPKSPLKCRNDAVMVLDLGVRDDDNMFSLLLGVSETICRYNKCFFLKEDKTSVDFVKECLKKLKVVPTFSSLLNHHVEIIQSDLKIQKYNESVLEYYPSTEFQKVLNWKKDKMQFKTHTELDHFCQNTFHVHDVKKDFRNDYEVLRALDRCFRLKERILGDKKTSHSIDPCPFGSFLGKHVKIMKVVMEKKEIVKL